MPTDQKNLNDDVNNKAHTYVNSKSDNINDDDIQKVLDSQDTIHKKINERSPLDRFLTDIKLFLGLLKDYQQKNYRKIPYKSIASIVTALLYLINPIDIVPDFIPIIGQIDDAVVFGLCLKLVESDLENYQTWLRTTETKTSTKV